MLRAAARAAPPGTVIPWAEASPRPSGAGQARELADPERNGQIAYVITELEQSRRSAEEQAARIAVDHKLLTELESIRGNRAEHIDAKRTDAEYAAAFRQAGLDLDANAPTLAGAWIAGRTVPVELASFLDDWAMVRAKAKANEQSIRRLVESAAQATLSPGAMPSARLYRSRPRGVAELHKLAADEKTLGVQPTESLLLLALRLKAAGDRESAASVLRRRGECGRTTSG